MIVKLSAVTMAGMAGLAGVASLNGNPATTSVAPTLAPAVVSTSAQADAYSVDGVHTSALFRIRHADVAPFWGRFDKLTGTMHHDPATGALSEVNIEIDVTSVNTNNGNRDDHVRNADFFNARQYPTSTFRSSSFSPDGEGGGTLTGELTLHGVTREVTATVREISTGSFRNTPKLGFEAEFEIQRSDFGITKYVADDGGDGGILGNTVRIIVAIEADGS